mmetsp:Transcript_30506/g.67152  ORF Transcript_30506/g.67152 Transcript_30506/m.67152 type:complete len:175 (-) Transcript_30506:75-599(-)
MGQAVGPQSSHGPDFVQLVWESNWSNDGAKPLTGVQNICTQEELSLILQLGAPFSEFEYARDCFGRPCHPSKFEPIGGAPLEAMRRTLPQFDFKYQTIYVGCGGGARFNHVVTIRHQSGAIGNPVQVGLPMMEVTVPDPVPEQMNVQAANGRTVNVVVPAGTKAGSTLQVTVPP